MIETIAGTVGSVLLTQVLRRLTDRGLDRLEHFLGKNIKNGKTK
jgi:hypothetical protein